MNCMCQNRHMCALRDRARLCMCFFAWAHEYDGTFLVATQFYRWRRFANVDMCVFRSIVYFVIVSDFFFSRACMRVISSFHYIYIFFIFARIEMKYTSEKNVDICNINASSSTKQHYRQRWWQRRRRQRRNKIMLR